MDIFQIFYNNKNEENAFYMSKYMKNKFSFLGLKKPERVSLSKAFLNQKKRIKKWTGTSYSNAMICLKGSFSI